MVKNKIVVLCILFVFLLCGCSKEDAHGVDMNRWMDMVVDKGVYEVRFGVKMFGEGGDVVGEGFEMVKGGDGELMNGIMVEIGDRKEYREVGKEGGVFVFDLEGCRALKIWGGVSELDCRDCGVGS